MSIRSSTVTGFGTSPSSVMYATDASQSLGSIAPRPPCSWTGPRHTSIVASRMAACVSRVEASSGTAVIAASTPTSGSWLISSMARSVAATKAAMASPLDSSAACPTISPLPGSGVISSTRRTFTASPVSSNWTGSLLANPVAASTAPWATAAPCPKSGYSTISRSSGVSPADFSSAWSMIHDDPKRPGMPSLLPSRSLASSMPDDAFANTTDGKRP